MNEMRIYVASLSDYNYGRLEGKWLDLSDYSDASELMEAIQEMLDEITKKYNDGEVREEWAVHDYEGIPSTLASEYMGEQDFQQLYDIAEVADDRGIPVEVLVERAGDTGSDDYQALADSLIMSVEGNDESDIVYEYENQIGELGFDWWSNHVGITKTDQRLLYGEDVDNFKEEILAENPDMDEDEAERQAEERADEEADERNSDLISYLQERGYENEFPNWVYKDYQSAWDELSYDFDVIHHDGNMYVFTNNYSLGGTILSGVIGAYIGYKIGRAKPQKKGFETEKKIGRKIKGAFSKKKMAKGGSVEKLADLMSYTDYLDQGWDDPRKKSLEKSFFGKNIDVKIDLITEGEFELAIADELEKIKMLSKKVDFDEVRGEIDYGKTENNTDLEFYKNGKLVMTLKGDYNSDNESLDTIIDLDGETTELNYHPADGFGGVNLSTLKKNINDAFKELGIYSAVVSIEGYEEYSEDVKGLETAKQVIQDIKGNTKFQVLKGRSVGIGKRVDDSRVIDEFAKGGSTSKSDLDILIDEINEKSGGRFYLGGAYGNYELWGKDKDGGDHRIEVGSRKDIREALIKNRYNSKFTQYAKGGSTSKSDGKKYFTIYRDEEGSVKTEFDNYSDALADYNEFASDDANIALYEVINGQNNLLKENESSADIEYVELSNGDIVVTLEKIDGKWEEGEVLDGEIPYGWGGKRYMGYLKPKDLAQWLNKDYGGYFEIVDQYAKGGGVDANRYVLMQDTRGFVEQGFWGVIDTEKNELVDIFEFKKEAQGYLKEIKEKGISKADASKFNGQIDKYGKGGGIGFKGLSSKVAKRYEGKPVAPKYQSQYGKTYSKSEAKEVGDKVAGKVYWQQQGRKMAKGGAVKKRSLMSVAHLVDWKGEGIKKWYIRSYPTDDLGEEINDTITFKDLWDGLHQKQNVYEIIGVDDSLVRERLFQYLSLIYDVDYSYIYDLWLSSDNYAKGGGVENNYNNPAKSTHVLHIDGQNWYLEKIDSTHFYMSNSPNYRGMAHHIGQHKGEPYYEEVREWLKSTFSEGGGVDGKMNFYVAEGTIYWSDESGVYQRFYTRNHIKAESKEKAKMIFIRYIENQTRTNEWDWAEDDIFIEPATDSDEVIESRGYLSAKDYGGLSKDKFSVDRFAQGGGVDYPNHYLEVEDLNQKINALTQQIEADYRNNEIDNYTDRNERELVRLKERLDWLMWGKDSYSQGGGISGIDDLLRG